METTQSIKTLASASNPHEPRQCCLSHVDGYVRSRAESDLPGSSESAGDAHLKCCMQVYHSLALITKGSVRTLVRSVEESNGAEAWRPIYSRYATDTQNRQYVLTQKIMMPSKLWCDHAEGFESGLRAWELGCRRMGTRFWKCVGRCSQVHSEDEHGTDFS